MNLGKLCANDWVEVRSKEEILQTLDKNGMLEGLHFMPEMFEYCGKRLRVYKRAHKTCDTVNDYRGRRMERAVHLEGSRCSGLGHGGCQAACLLFWKEAWLKPVPGPSSAGVPAPAAAGGQSAPSGPTGSGCREEDVTRATIVAGSNPADPVYACQATHLPGATSPLPWWKMGQYVEDFSSGNVGLWQVFKGVFYMGYYNLSCAGIGIGAPMRWLYDRFQTLIGGVPYPRRTGTIPAGERTPSAVLNLQPGEVVRVKSHNEILGTLDAQNKNRGLYFDAEVVPYCGGTYRVVSRVDKIINEKNGKMIKLKNSVILESVFCQARYSNDRLFCPRSLYQFMHEIWLERVTPNGEGSRTQPAVCRMDTAHPR